MQGRGDVDAVLEETPYPDLMEWVAYWSIRDGIKDDREEAEMTPERAAASADQVRLLLGSARPVRRAK